MWNPGFGRIPGDQSRDGLELLPPLLSPLLPLGETQPSLPGSLHHVHCVAWLARRGWTSTPIHVSVVQSTGGTVVLNSRELRP